MGGNGKNDEEEGEGMMGLEGSKGSNLRVRM